MKQKVLILVIAMAIYFPFSALADNGADWLIIQKHTGLTTEQIAEQAKEKALKQKKSLEFSELYVKEELPGSGEAVSFEQLRVQKSRGANSFKLVSGQLFELESTVGEVVTDHCDVPSDMTLKELIGAVLEDNDLDWESAKQLKPGFEFFIRSKWLKEKYRNPLERIAELEANNTALELANAQLRQLVVQARAEADNAVAEANALSIQTNTLSAQVKELSEAKEALLIRLSLLQEKVVDTAKIIKAGIGFNTEETIENISAILKSRNAPSWTLIGMIVAIAFLFVWVFKLHGALKKERSNNTAVPVFTEPIVDEEESDLSLNVIADTPWRAGNDHIEENPDGGSGQQNDEEDPEDEFEQLLVSEAGDFTDVKPSREELLKRNFGFNSAKE